MNPLIGIAVGILPDIVKLIAGDKTGQLTRPGRKSGFPMRWERQTPLRRKRSSPPGRRSQNCASASFAELALEAAKGSKNAKLTESGDRTRSAAAGAGGLQAR